MKIINISKNKSLGNNIKIADNFLLRLFGLIPKKNLLYEEGLLIKPCNSIHTFFMRFSIDVLFVDKNNKVIYILEGLKPWKLSKIVRHSKYVIELPVGTIQKSNTQVGDIIK